MNDSFSPSINIIRDEQNDFKYIPTPNSELIVSQLQEDYSKGLRSFTLIGSYGSGKSSFLLALEQTLSNHKLHFNLTSFKWSETKFLKIVGTYGSIISSFADALDVKNEKNVVEHILSEIYNRYYELKDPNSLLVVVIDELGKFLEYAAKNNPEKELYFLQQLAEFSNNNKNNILLITTVHQGFETYAYELNKNLRQEWTKVKGRFKEITFNEPVEQLLYLAAEHISHATNLEYSKKEVDVALYLYEYTKSI
jgi:DNA replication protein DnaC